MPDSCHPEKPTGASISREVRIMFESDGVKDDEAERDQLVKTLRLDAHQLFKP